MKKNIDTYAYGFLRFAILAVSTMLVCATPARTSESTSSAALAHRGSQATVAGAIGQTVTIPAETEVATELLSALHTQVSQVGDTVMARLSKPLYINGRVALPLGTLLDGRITRVRPAGRLHRPAELSLRFERIALPDGQAETVRGVLAALEGPRPFKTRLDNEGYLKGAPSLSWKSAAGGLLALSAIAVTSGAAAGSAAFSSLIPAGAASALTFAFVWRRGSDVHLPPDTQCRVRLVYPVTVRVPW